MSSYLLTNIHEGIENENDLGNTTLIVGDYEYFHYVCDGFDDRGWGCGYRTLQTICSWIRYNTDKIENVPSIKEIQEILVRIEDKPKSFVNSRQWIGSFEVCLVIDEIFNIPCKMVHVNKGDELAGIVDTIRSHFMKFGSPIMMGGDMDCSSKGVLGICGHGADSKLLILDPHYTGKVQTKEFLQNKGWVKWIKLSDFLSTSFYNLCLPQVPSRNKT